MSVIETLTKAKQDPKRAIKVLNNKLFSTIGQNSYIPFIILSRSRSGSNLLVSFLNSHPNVFSEAEIFGKVSRKSYQQILASVFSKQPFYCKAKGFKIFYYHPRDKSAMGVWDTLEAMKNLHVIHLKRDNILHTLLSRRIAGIKDSWVAKSNSDIALSKQQEIQVEFTHEVLKEGFETTRQYERDAEQRFKNHPMLSISYEDLTSDPESTFRTITEFLGVKNIAPRTVTRKQGKKRIRDSIVNYDEMKDSFSGTEWARFFDE